MKTYSEKYETAPIDWHDRIDRLDTMLAGEIIDSANAAASWITCACGNQCAAIPRAPDGEPLDVELWGHGLEFANLWSDVIHTSACYSLYQKRLKACLARIEKRSTELLTELGVSQ